MKINANNYNDLRQEAMSNLISLVDRDDDDLAEMLLVIEEVLKMSVFGPSIPKDGIWDSEGCIPVANGKAFFCFPSFDSDQDGCEYVRFIDSETGEELLYEHYTELAEDPQFVMGAICGMMINGEKK